MVFSIGFDFALFEENGVVEPCEYDMIVQYDGVNKPTIVNTNIIAYA